ncbi:hypothetical protein CY34DRAFT_798025 [Suillus luteus UH-Slu-Lm8-n1]|uniref:Uncharacterized protein n=1 Tax=Suillus luteus UH-Slu-Lm8-n1 TaxID=930992 RepID=A0A0D0B3D5_9AGAM|nr:hypothetical protein CY34DRAFT_798025 [Suillus luteus UH-Slu-Lm8-n1]
MQFTLRSSRCLNNNQRLKITGCNNLVQERKDERESAAIRAYVYRRCIFESYPMPIMLV